MKNTNPSKKHWNRGPLYPKQMASPISRRDETAIRPPMFSTRAKQNPLTSSFAQSASFVCAIRLLLLLRYLLCFFFYALYFLLLPCNPLCFFYCVINFLLLLHNPLPSSFSQSTFIFFCVIHFLLLLRNPLLSSLA